MGYFGIHGKQHMVGVDERLVPYPEQDMFFFNHEVLVIPQVWSISTENHQLCGKCDCTTPKQVLDGSFCKGLAEGSTDSGTRDALKRSLGLDIWQQFQSESRKRDPSKQSWHMLALSSHQLTLYT